MDACVSHGPLVIMLGGEPCDEAELKVFISMSVFSRPPRGAPTGLLPFYPGTDDQTMPLIGRSIAWL